MLRLWMMMLNGALVRLFPQTGLRLTSHSHRGISCGSLRVLSENRDSASRVSLCYPAAKSGIITGAKRPYDPLNQLYP